VPTPESRARVVGGMLSLALPVLVLWRCAAQPGPRPVAANAVASASAASPSPTLDAALDATQRGSANAPVGGASNDAAPAAASGATPLPAASLTPSPSASSRTAGGIIAAVARRDPRDLALLSRIERELKRDPPPAVHALIRMREAGAARHELLAEADKQLGSDVALRVLVGRWIDEAAPGTAAPSKSLGPTQGGTQDPLIKPIVPKRR
jgi:hypothetical protein